jgi:hypothetical protein
LLKSRFIKANKKARGRSSPAGLVSTADPTLRLPPARTETVVMGMMAAVEPNLHEAISIAAEPDERQMYVFRR